MKEYFIPSGLYQILKWLGLIACPAIATFIGAVFPAWGIPNVDAIVLTLNSAGVLIGALIGVSAATSKQVNSQFGADISEDGIFGPKTRAACVNADDKEEQK